MSKSFHKEQQQRYRLSTADLSKNPFIKSKNLRWSIIRGNIFILNWSWTWLQTKSESPNPKNWENKQTNFETNSEISRQERSPSKILDMKSKGCKIQTVYVSICVLLCQAVRTNFGIWNSSIKHQMLHVWGRLFELRRRMKIPNKLFQKISLK